MKSLLFVCAFKDIGRDRWDFMRRNLEEYSSYFRNLAENIDYRMILYIDQKTLAYLRMAEITMNSNIEIRNYDIPGSFLDKYIELDESIIKNFEYRQKLSKIERRNMCPEYNHADYNLTNHNKFHFLVESKRICPNYDYYIWIDFGCIREVENLPKCIDTSRLNNRIVYLTQEMPLSVKTFEEVLKVDDDLVNFRGAQIIVPTFLVETLCQKYEETLLEMYSKCISDDDQSVILQVFYKNPELFELYQNKDAYTLFQLFFNVNFSQPTDLCEIIERHGSDKGAKSYKSWHNYTPFYHSIFKEKRNHPLRLFELGIGSKNPNIPSNMGPNGVPGASLRAWKEYFPKGQIVGADIDKEILFQEDRITTLFCDQLDKNSIRELWRNVEGEFDIMIEDALHMFSANKHFFENSVYKLKKGGVYIIEDILKPAIFKFQEQLVIWKKNYPYLDFQLIRIPYDRNTEDNTILLIHYV